MRHYEEIDDCIDSSTIIKTKFDEQMELIDEELASLEKSKEKMLTASEKMFTDRIENYKTAVAKRKNNFNTKIGKEVEKKVQHLTKIKREITQKRYKLSTTYTACEVARRAGKMQDIINYTRTLRTVTTQVSEGLDSIDLGANDLKIVDKSNPKRVIQVKIEEDITGSRLLPQTAVFELIKAVACQQSSGTVTVSSFKQKLLTARNISVVITDEAGKQVSAVVASSTEGQYAVRFTPKIKGLHTLQVLFQEQVLAGAKTKFTVESNNPVLKFGGCGTAVGEMRTPTSVLVDREGNIYVADNDNKRMQKFNDKGLFLKRLPMNTIRRDASVYNMVFNKAQDAIIYPQCLLDNEDDIRAATGPVCRYGVEQDTIQVISEHPMSFALCIAINSKDEFVVSDATRKRLVMFNRDGGFLRKIGDGSGLFQCPDFLCIDAEDHILVSDRELHCILKIDIDGQVLLKIGSPGNGHGQFDDPRGIATDGNLIIVADNNNKRIQLFSRDGQFAGALDSDQAPLNFPLGVAVTSDGRIVVADCGNNCVKVFNYNSSVHS